MQEIIQVIENALAEERQNKEKYLKLAQTANAPGIKLMFEQLARDEESHEKQLFESLKALRLLYPDEKPAIKPDRKSVV